MCERVGKYVIKVKLINGQGVWKGVRDEDSHDDEDDVDDMNKNNDIHHDNDIDDDYNDDNDDDVDDGNNHFPWRNIYYWTKEKY